MSVIGHRYSLLAVVGAGFFVSAPVATWLAVEAITADAPALDVDAPAAPAPAHALDLEALAQELHIVPAYTGGRVVGLKVFGVRPGSPVAQAGLQNGDVVERVNGIHLTSPERAAEALERAHDGLVVIDFVRRGQRGTLTHRFHVHPVTP